MCIRALLSAEPEAGSLKKNAVDSMMKRCSGGSSNIDKVYIATIEGNLSDTDKEKLEKGVMVDGKLTSPCEAKVTKVNKEKNKTIVKLTIHEGRNHQVKKMFEAINKNVIKLHREEFAGISSKGLYEGQHRKLTFEEVRHLKDIAYKKKEEKR